MDAGNSHDVALASPGLSLASHTMPLGKMGAIAKPAATYANGAAPGIKAASNAMEATAEPGDVPWAWRQYAYRGYLLLQELDRRLLESRLPAAIFYNLMISARKRPTRQRPTGTLISAGAAGHS